MTRPSAVQKKKQIPLPPTLLVSPHGTRKPCLPRESRVERVTGQCRSLNSGWVCWRLCQDREGGVQGPAGELWKGEIQQPPS